MKTPITLLLLIASISFPGRLTSGQTQSPQQPEDVLRIRTNEVRLDVVVKDKKGRPIKDLATGDFEIYEDAIGQYQKALAVDSRNQAIRFNLALAYYKASLFAEAAGEFARFLEIAPQNLPERTNAVLLLADCQVRLGEYKKVIQLLSPLAEADPNNRTVAFLLGSALVSDGQLDKGQLLIDRVFRGEDSIDQ